MWVKKEGRAKGGKIKNGMAKGWERKTGEG
jgi:hypothetical protein